MTIEEYLDARQVAKRLGVSVSAVHRLSSRGTLGSTWFAGKRAWLRSAVERYEADPVAQARRRSRSTLLLGDQDLTVEKAIDSMREAKKQAGGEE